MLNCLKHKLTCLHIIKVICYAVLTFYISSHSYNIKHTRSEEMLMQSFLGISQDGSIGQNGRYTSKYNSKTF